MQSLLILGRQPKIGLAELESLYGKNKVSYISTSEAAILDVDPCLVNFDRLGGSIKFTKILTTLETTSWGEIEQFLITDSPGHSQNMPKGKMQLGISAYGYDVSPKQILKTAIQLKQAIRQTGRSVRVIPNNSNALNSAQIIHNNLLTKNGWELIIVKDNHRSIIAQTIKVQDINAYSKRDRNRPNRDPKVGMLPPKLAQIIVNLAIGLQSTETFQAICDIPSDQPIPKAHFNNHLLLDPFCGTGVILQEAAIMGYDCLGTDIDQRMVQYSTDNIEWLKQLTRSPLNPNVQIKLALGDATNYTWTNDKTTVIASETYLGRPLPSTPTTNQIHMVRNECEEIIKKFLTNIYPQINSGTRLCLAIPAWQQKSNRFTHLPFLDSLELIGYNRISFQYSEPGDLIYYRPNQVVGRELLVLTRK
jgi:tRNA G10  N-methylase Trm11